MFGPKMVSLCGCVILLVATGAEADAASAVKLEDVTVVVTVLRPEALSRPVLPVPNARRGLEDQRRRYEAAKGSARFAEGETLALLLWAEGKPAFRTEAQRVLRELAAGMQASEKVLARLHAVELNFGDEVAATTALDELFRRFPNGSEAKRLRVFRAHQLLKDGDDAGAVGLIAEAGRHARAEATYLEAWLAFRKGDHALAWKRLGAAARERGGLNPAGLARDAMIFASRGGIAPIDAAGFLAQLAKGDNPLPELLFGLAQAYGQTGRQEARIQTLELAARGATPELMAEIRFGQSDAEYKLGRPQRAADRAIEAWEAAQAPTVPPAIRDRLAKHIFVTATIFHRAYGTAYTPAYGDAARRLFAAYLKIPARPDEKDARDRARALEEVRPNGPGRLETEVAKRRVQAQVDVVAACYEKALLRSPRLAGTLAATAEIDGRGVIVALRVEPSPPVFDGVGACVAEQMKGWSFPAFGGGAQRVAVQFELKPGPN